MERIRNVLRNSFRFSKREKRSPPITADAADADGGHEDVVSTVGGEPQNDDADVVRNGTCFFTVKYYGSLPVFEPRGIELCRVGMKETRRRFGKLKRRERDANRGLALHISGESLRLVNEKTHTLVADEPIEKVSFCMADRTHRKAFCFVSRDAMSDAWLLHAFKTDVERGKTVVGDRVCHAIGFAFQLHSSRHKSRLPSASSADAFRGSLSIANASHLAADCSGMAKLSPIAEEDTVISAGHSRSEELPSGSGSQRCVSDSEFDESLPENRERPDGFANGDGNGNGDGDGDCFENEASTLLLRGVKARATVAVAQSTGRTPPKRPPPLPFSRNAPERHTIQTVTPATLSASGADDPALAFTRSSLNFSLKLPGLAKKPLPPKPKPAAKTATVSAFKEQLATRLLSEVTDESPAWSANTQTLTLTLQPDESATSTSTSTSASTLQENLKVSLPFATRFHHASLSSQSGFDVVTRRLLSSESESTDTQPEATNANGSEAHNAASAEPMTNEDGADLKEDSDHDHESGNGKEPIRSLISKFERRSMTNETSLGLNNDPFANAPLSNALRARHSAR